MYNHISAAAAQNNSKPVCLKKSGQTTAPEKRGMKGSVIMEQYLCPCGYLYNEELGCPSEGIAPGTKFEDIPDDWHCPVCGLTKEYFGSREEIEEAVE